MQTNRFRRKQFDIDEVQVTAENMEECAKWCGGRIRSDSTGAKFIKVRVNRPLNDRQTKAFVTDHVLLQNGSFKVYTHKAFESSFEPVPTDEAAPVSVPAGTDS